jgi:hypothetical protein
MRLVAGEGKRMFNKGLMRTLRRSADKKRAADEAENCLVILWP